jgi:BASS family bile acid:Na+ symporter
MFERYHEYEGLLVTGQIVLVMLGMGATLAPADFVAIARRPRGLLVGISCQFLVAPLLTLLLLRLCKLDPGIVVGLLLIAAMPGGPLANLFTHLAKGDVALSIVMTAVGTLGSLISVPLIMQLFADDLVPVGFRMPIAQLMQDLLAFLLVPLGVGMLCRSLSRAWAESVSPWLIRMGSVLLLCIVTGSLASGRIDPLHYGWGTPIAIIVLCLVIQNSCIALFSILRWPVAEQTAVGIGVTIRNINLALLLLGRLFPAANKNAPGSDIGAGVLYVIFFWGALSLIVCVPSIYFQRQALRAEQARLASARQE